MMSALRCLCLVFSIERDECKPINPCRNGTCVDRLRDYTCNCTSMLSKEGIHTYYTGRNCSSKGENEKLLYNYSSYTRLDLGICIR